MSPVESSKLPPPQPPGKPSGKVVPFIRRRNAVSEATGEPVTYGPKAPPTERRPAGGPMPQELPPPPDTPPGSDPAATDGDKRGKRVKKRTRGKDSGNPPDEPRHYRKELKIGFGVVGAIVLIVLMMIYPVIFWTVLVLGLLSGPAAFLVVVFRRQARIREKTPKAHKLTINRQRAVGIHSNSGGSGKTTATVSTATGWARVSILPVGVFDFNNDAGEAGAKLGFIKGAMARLHDVFQHRGDPVKLVRMFRNLHSNDDGIVVIDCEVNQKAADQLPEEQVPEIIAAGHLGFHDIFLDNGTSNTGAWEMASARFADVVIVVGQTGKPASVRAIPKTIADFKANGVEDIEERVIVLLSRPHRFRKDRNRMPGLNPDIKVCTLPWDPHLKVVEEGRPLKWEWLMPRTKEAILDLIIAICEKSPATHEELTPQDDPDAWINQILSEVPRAPQAWDSPPPSTIHTNPSTHPEDPS